MAQRYLLTRLALWTRKTITYRFSISSSGCLRPFLNREILIPRLRSGQAPAQYAWRFRSIDHDQIQPKSERIIRQLIVVRVLCLVASLHLAGCVERKLTIFTEPQGALVTLNDEEIGESPTTVNFQWYGDYNVRISKEGYETLSTHRELKGPWYDEFPFDFFAQIVNPNRIADSYEWTFELSPKRQISREELIRNAQEAEKQLQ